VQVFVVKPVPHACSNTTATTDRQHNRQAGRQAGRQAARQAGRQDITKALASLARL